MERSRNKGFTLIELMIVVAIIGTLAAVAAPAYVDYTKRGYVTEGMALASGAKSAIMEYYAVNNSFAVGSPSNAAYGLPNMTDYASKYVESVAVGDVGLIQVAFNSKVHASKKYLNLIPSVSVDGVITWTCVPAGVDGVPTNFLPTTCR